MEPIPFSDHIQSIELASPEEDEQIKSVNVSGWGLTLHETNETYGGFRLKETTLSIVDMAQCLAPIPLPERNDKKRYFCTRDTRVNRSEFGACHGDSGGPVARRTKNGTLVVVAKLTSAT